jgi:molybdopterin/thiamine biosynthesis adenylyltransferase
MDTERYSRQILFAPIGEHGQRLLAQRCVAIVGMGALGSVLANHMVRAGVGDVRLIDRDFVEPSNLQRQILYDEKDAANATPKAVAAAEKLQAVNHTVQIHPHVADLTGKNAAILLGGVDLVLDGTDNYETRYLMNDFCIKHNIPWIYGGVVGSHGITATFLPESTACLRCLFEEPPAPETRQTCDTVGVIGPVVDIIASYQAAEALKILTGNVAALRGTLLQLDVWDNEFASIRLSHAKRPDCPCCGKREFSYLFPRETETAVLCGRNSVQVQLPARGSVDLDRMANQLAPHGRVERTKYLLRLHTETWKLTCFPDGRVIVQGVNDTARARSICARYLGM